MSEAARIRESIDLAEFERRLRSARAEEPQQAYGAHSYEPVFEQPGLAGVAAPAAPARPSYPRTAAPSDAQMAPNPVASLREALEDAAGRPDPFHATIDKFPDAAERFAVEPPAAPEAGWRPEAFEPIGEKPASSRKRMLLLGGAAAVLVVGVGLAVTMRGGPSGGNAPTIRASSDPFKIQPEAKPAGEKPSESASILDRNGSERLAASRVVTREEQPVDVREAARQAAASGRPGPTAGAAPSSLPTAGPAANNFFPEPRRVRTVAVRPDGTIIGEVAPPPAPAPAQRAAAPVASAPARPAAAPAPQAAAPQPAQQARAAAPTPPKATERAAPTTTASTNAAATPAPAAPRAASPQPAATASTPRSGGGFAVQLAAPGSESEAKAVMARIQQRYGSALGGHQPTVRKASVGDKEVYRVRLVGMSQSDANGVCEKLKAAGASCFVARE